MKPEVIHVDAFTDRPFAGNPAAVCLLSQPCDDRWLQAIAAEMNLSETAFLLPQQDGYLLRWFTPKVEVDLCGHATLASAHVLWSEGHVPLRDEIRFQSRSGVLGAQRRGDVIELDFPSEPSSPAAPPPGLVEAIGAAPCYVGQNRFDFLLELDGEDQVRNLAPDFHQLAQVAARGIIVTSRAASAPYDFVSRFFAPRVGVNEDPVTGSAHCCLGPFWGERLGKTEMHAFQASQRGGEVQVRLADGRVKLGGQAVTVMKGRLV